jgi:hypothetical protein
MGRTGYTTLGEIFPVVDEVLLIANSIVKEYKNGL